MNQRVDDRVVLTVCAGRRVGGGADKQSSSSPDTWPTFTAASHVTLLLTEKDPLFVRAEREGGREGGGLWGEAPLSFNYSTIERKKERKKKGGRRKEAETGLPTLPGVLFTPSVAFSFSSQTQAHQSRHHHSLLVSRVLSGSV